MSRDLSDAYLEQAFQQESANPEIYLVSMTHPDFSEDIHVSSDATETLSSGHKGTISNGVEYTNFPFKLKLQEQNENLIPKASLEISNVSREIMDAIQRIQDDVPVVRVQMVLASDPDLVEIDIRNMRFNNIKGNAIVIEGELRPKAFNNGKYPKGTFNAAEWPGLHGK